MEPKKQINPIKTKIRLQFLIVCSKTSKKSQNIEKKKVGRAQSQNIGKRKMGRAQSQSIGKRKVGRAQLSRRLSK